MRIRRTTSASGENGRSKGRAIGSLPAHVLNYVRSIQMQDFGYCWRVSVTCVWSRNLTYVDKSDVDEIIEEHLKNGRIVDRLKI